MAAGGKGDSCQNSIVCVSLQTKRAFRASGPGLRNPRIPVRSTAEAEQGAVLLVLP